MLRASSSDRTSLWNALAALPYSLFVKWCLPVGVALWCGCGLTLDFDPKRAADGGLPVTDAAAAEAARQAAATCAELHTADPSLPNGEYTFKKDGVETKVYCDMTSDGGGFTRIVQFSAAAGTCPSGLAYVTSVKGCDIDAPSCSGESRSLFFDTLVPTYKEVRGIVRGYMFQTPDAFEAAANAPSIDGPYVDGVSITTGSPRRHIWTFAAGLLKPDTATSHNTCPCDGGPAPPAFVGGAFTCETGNNLPTYANQPVWFSDDLLWDPGGDAAGGAPCGPVQAPGAFHATLSSATSGPIEVRVLFDQCDDNIALTRLELFVR